MHNIMSLVTSPEFMFLGSPRAIRQPARVFDLQGQRLRTDVVELSDSDELRVDVDLPGVRKEDVKLEVHNQKHSTGNQSILISYSRGEQQGSLIVYVSDRYNVDDTVAKLDLGVLSLTLKKTSKNSRLIELT